jgi:hypothetical protein
LGTGIHFITLDFLFSSGVSSLIGEKYGAQPTAGGCLLPELSTGVGARRGTDRFRI